MRKVQLLEHGHGTNAFYCRQAIALHVQLREFLKKGQFGDALNLVLAKPQRLEVCQALQAFYDTDTVGTQVQQLEVLQFFQPGDLAQLILC